MNSKNWPAYLNSLDPDKIDLGLDRISQVAKQLKIKFTCPVITVTGTNGKGSCVATLDAIYRSGGYRVGAYTSPHLLHFNERIRINGEMINEAALDQAYLIVDQARGDILLTFFEFVTLAAFVIFQNAALDILILEVGLGGRFDAVNIIDADVAIVTTIGIDHIDRLGPTRASIAYEKAGIFRPKQRVICGEREPPQNLLDIAATLNCDFYRLDKDYFYDLNNLTWRWFNKNINYVDLPVPQLELQNVATALMAVESLQSRLTINIATIQQALSTLYLPGRWQQINNCYFDVGHNPHASAWLAQQLIKTPCAGKTFAVVGMLADKDIQGTFNAVKEWIDCWYVGSLSVARGASAEILAQTLAQIGAKQWYNYPTIQEAFMAAKSVATETDRLIVFGSFYTVAFCLELIVK